MSSTTRYNAPKRGAVLAGIDLAGFCAAAWVLISLVLVVVGVGLFLVPNAIRGLRGAASRARRKAYEWNGVEIPDPYTPDREFRRDLQGRVEELQYLFRDQTAVRDLTWGVLTGVVGFVLGFLPLALIIYGVQGFVQAPLWLALHSNVGYGADYTGIPITSLGYALICVPIGAGFVLAGFTQGPALLSAHGRWTAQMLNPTQAALERRVQELTESRAEAVDASAAELRRIERDLHDGAQARLVAMGMTLGAIEHLLEKDPDKAKQLLAETRLASTKALHELRDLVRGIHPPVLADRGLSDAVKALALDNPLKIEVTSTLAGRLEPPLESAAYFAVSEVLTNAAKHAEAGRVWIELGHNGEVLKISVTDDGKGGASLDGGTGLRGIERRIGAFDGVLALSSPVGGPTVVSMEIPCPAPTRQA